MANKKISEFPVTTSLADSDIFLVDHVGSTSTVSFSTVSNTISQTVSSSITNSLTGDTVIRKLSTNFIKKPASASNGQVLTYNGSTSTWGADSLSANGFNASLSSNGYQKLPSGLIMQWGKDSTDVQSDGGVRTITFPIPFPTACFQVLVSPENSDGSYIRDLAPQVKTITTTNVVVYNNSTGIGGTSNVPTIWFAIGY